jgi:ketosteroid isomerase-like protein
METIEQFLRNLNDAWLAHRFDELGNYFHDSVVMLPPGTSEPVTGAEKMVEGYRQFLSMATIHSFHVKDISIFNFDSVALCHLQFEVDYEINGSRSREEGIEVYVIGRFDSALKVVWRTQIQLAGNNV